MNAEPPLSVSEETARRIALAIHEVPIEMLLRGGRLNLDAESRQRAAAQYLEQMLEPDKPFLPA